jgi:hypothetical protein
MIGAISADLQPGPAHRTLHRVSSWRAWSGQDPASENPRRPLQLCLETVSATAEGRNRRSTSSAGRFPGHLGFPKPHVELACRFGCAPIAGSGWGEGRWASVVLCAWPIARRVRLGVVSGPSDGPGGWRSPPHSAHLWSRRLPRHRPILDVSNCASHRRAPSAPRSRGHRW